MQDFLRCAALENTSKPSPRVHLEPDVGVDFVSEVVERADIGLMFDVNNVYVSAYNHGF
ncbi:MAG: DUF692 family protein [Polyangiaceae bacterium]